MSSILLWAGIGLALVVKPLFSLPSQDVVGAVLFLIGWILLLLGR